MKVMGRTYAKPAPSVPLLPHLIIFGGYIRVLQYKMDFSWLLTSFYFNHQNVPN